MDIAVIGAGVNGICCAVALAEKGCKVTVYESKTPFTETSSKSSKLLHGGIRYIETFHLKLVREALADRAWWIEKAKQYTKINRFFFQFIKISQGADSSFILVSRSMSGLQVNILLEEVSTTALRKP